MPSTGRPALGPVFVCRPITISGTVAFDLAGDGAHSALGLPGDRRSTYAGASIGFQPVPGLLLDARLEKATASDFAGAPTAFVVSAQAAIASRLVVSMTGAESVSGAGGGIGTMGLIWRPWTSGWALIGSATGGKGPLTSLLMGDTDSIPSQLSLAIAAPITEAMMLRIDIRSHSSQESEPSLDTSPFTVIITRNL